MSNIIKGKYDIQRIMLVTTKNKTLNVKEADKNFKLSYEETLFGGEFSFGELSFIDYGDAAKQLPLIGEERLELEYNIFKSSKTIKKYFRIYQVSATSEANATGISYKLKFVTEEQFENLNMVVSRSFKKRIDQIVVDLLNLMGGEFDQKNITRTLGIHHFVFPNIHPIEAINMAGKYASHESYTGGTFFLFQNSNGFNFKCLEELFVQKSLGVFKEQLQSVAGKGDRQKDFGIQDFKVISSSADTLGSMGFGLYGSRCIAYDPLVKVYEEKVFSYAKEFKAMQHLNRFPLSTPDDKFTSPDQRIEFVASNSIRQKYKSNQHMNGLDDAHSNGAEKFLSKSKSLFEQITSKQVSFNIKGDDVPSLYDPDERPFTVGMVIEIDHFTKSEDSTRSGQLDNYISGKYLVTKCKHKLNFSSYEIEVEAMSDSHSGPHEKGLTVVA